MERQESEPDSSTEGNDTRFTIMGEMMGYSWSRSVILPVMLLILSCGNRDVRFGTPEYWELPAADQQAVRDSFIQEQKQEGHQLHERTVSYATFHGTVVARQYSAWLSWAHEIEDDPVRAAEIISEWKKELVHIRRGRKNDPTTLNDLIAWIGAHQRTETGSWAPDNAPIWLHIEEIGRALEIIRLADYPVKLSQRILPLGIIRNPAVVRTMLREALDRSKRTGYTRELSALAWLPWLRYATISELEWPERWGEIVRTICIREWLDPATGGFGINRGEGFDMEATHRLIRGWNDDALVFSYIPSPQKMALSVVTMADTLSLKMKPRAVMLLVGSIADQDSLMSREICSIIKQWQEHAYGIISAKSISGDTLTSALSIALYSGIVGGPPAEWMLLADCAGLQLQEKDREIFRTRIGGKINAVENITMKFGLHRVLSLLR